MKVFTKLIVSLLTFVACSWPTIMYFAARWLLHPHGFWQELLLFGLGFYMLAGAQFVFACIFFLVVFNVWVE